MDFLPKVLVFWKFSKQILEGLVSVYREFPLPSDSHHQDYYVFSSGFWTTPWLATTTGKGDNPMYIQG